MRDNLIVFSSRKRRCFPGEGNQSSPHTSGADVDGKQEILLHSGFRSQELSGQRSVYVRSFSLYPWFGVQGFQEVQRKASFGGTGKFHDLS